MKRLIVCLFLLVLPMLGSDNGSKSFEGEISDSQCGFNVHSLTRSHDEMLKTGYMGKNAQECAVNCVRGRSGQFVFVSNDRKNAYRLEPQDAVQPYAGKPVRIHGTLAKGTIHVLSIAEIGN